MRDSLLRGGIFAFFATAGLLTLHVYPGVTISFMRAWAGVSLIGVSGMLLNALQDEEE